MLNDGLAHGFIQGEEGFRRDIESDSDKVIGPSSVDPSGPHVPSGLPKYGPSRSS